MNEEPPVERDAAEKRMAAAAIKGRALGALLAGGVCLYFGFGWLVDAPASAGEDATPTWYAVDCAFRWGLRIVGGAFVIVAALAASGSRPSMLLGAVVEGVFALLMLAMTVETYLEARADGHFDATVILLAILAVVGLSAARHSWALYVRAGHIQQFPDV